MCRQRPKHLLSILGTVLIGASPCAVAHHSFAAYDLNTQVEIRGTVVELQWRNPHIGVAIETIDSKGERTIREIELAGVSEAITRGLREEAIAPGSFVIVRAYPGRRGPQARAVGLEVRANDGTLLLGGIDADAAPLPDLAIEADGLAGRWVPTAEGFVASVAAQLAWPYQDESARTAVFSAMTEAGAPTGICDAFPPPLLSFFPDLREIEIGEDMVSIRYEAQGLNLERTFYMDETMVRSDVAPSLMGHSTGRWRGETLVVESTGFTSHNIGIAAGVPSSTEKHLIERFSLTDDRRHLRYELELRDNSVLAEPATITMLWEHRPDIDFSGVPCDPDIAEQLLREAILE